MHTHRRRRHCAALWLACLAGFGFLVGSALAKAPVWPMQWQVEGQHDHPLVGQIWHPATQSRVSPEQLRRAADQARFVILGETHDNPDHHRLQAAVLQSMASAGRRPALAFEMLDSSQQAAVDAFLRGRPASADGLGAAVAWDKTGWPSWTIYAPIAEVAVAHGLPIVAANLPTDTVKAVAMKGLDALGPERVKNLGLDTPLPENWRKVMLDELFESHCKLVPREALGGMVGAQRTRNAVMASSMLKAATTNGTVLIAGAGHARTDFGVPMVLHQDAPDASVLSVAMLEVQAGLDQPSDYAADFRVGKLPFDYVVFTPRAERADPCIGLREKMRHKPVTNSK